jgi:general secretion pathway protein K
MARVRGAGGSKPRPGPVLTIAELRLIEGMTDADLARLAPLLAALPGQTPINANTVLPEVLAAFLPDVPVQVVRDALASRDQTPYESTADFQTRMARRLSERAQAALPMGRITVASDWFEARIAAQLDMVDRRRTLILRRNPVDGATEIVLTLPAPEPD